MSMNFATNVVVNTNNSLQAKVLKAPTTSGGSNYGVGSSGQVLLTNGSSIYWGESTFISSRPNYQAGITDNTVQPLVNDLRANHLAFLPPDQIIIEKTTDGGTTWVDAGIADSVKQGLFSETRPSVSLPLINGQKNILCGLRVTFTAMKYNVPANTTETSKYNYWNDQYVTSTERYNNLREMYFWISSGPDKMNIKVERATGKAPNNWIVSFENNNALFSGWSGNDYIKLNSNQTFGGGTTQTGNYWNYRITFMSAYNSGTTEFTASSIASAQSISEIRGYGTNWWARGNQYASSDHMYSWDYQKNVTFPAKITAVDYIGKINGVTVPSNPQFTDTTYTFDGTYNASTNKAATVSTVTNAIAALDGNLNNTTAGVGKTLTAFSQTDGKINATFDNISITKSQISDLGTIGTAAEKGVTDNSSNADVTSNDTNLITGRTLYYQLAKKGYTTNTGTITGITMNGASKGTSGVVDLGTVITAHQDISGKVDGPASATNNSVAIFDGTGGKTIKNSGFTIGKSVPSDAVFTDTTYSDATQSAHGLMSTTDKTKLDNLNINEAKVLILSTTASSLPTTISNSAITSDMVVLKSELNNPSMQESDFTVTTSTGSLTITGTLNGSTTITLYLMKSR